MYPLEQPDKVYWSDELSCHFKRAQESVNDCQVIILPPSSDALWIVRDDEGSYGSTSTLYLMRNSERKLGGFFNAQLRKKQMLWLPSEV